MKVIRQARAEDLLHAEELVVSSINDLTVRHGFGPMATLRPPDFQMFSLRDDPDGVWVAEENGAIVGFALSWVCGSLWFLAELFVGPGQQGRGLGNALLARAFAHADKAGAVTRSLITFTFNVVSQGLYARHGLLPRLPVYMLSADRAVLTTALPDDMLRVSPLAPIPTDLKTLAEIDGGALGVAREKHHRYLLNDTTMNGVLLHDDHGCVGYAYVSATGHVGPLAVVRADRMGAAFKTALGLAAASGAAEVSAFLPGVSDALGIAVRQQMQIRFPMVLAADRDFGDWRRYLPRNPGFM